MELHCAPLAVSADFLIIFFCLRSFPHANDCMGTHSKHTIMKLICYFNYLKDGAVQRRVNIAGLTAILGKTCLQGWPLAASENLSFLHPRTKSSSLGLNCL